VACCRVVVVGNINVDFVLRTQRLPRRGETLLAESFSVVAGGKGANQAVAAARLGAQVALLGRLGNDVFGEQLLDNLVREGISTRLVERDQAQHTGTALVMVEPDGRNAILTALGANMGYQPEALAQSLRPALEGADGVLVQLGVPLGSVEAVVGVATALGKRVFLDPTPLRAGLPANWRRAYAVTPNETEVSALCGLQVRSRRKAKEACLRLLEEGVKVAVVKLGAQGVVLGYEGEARHLPALPVDVVDTTGAGDAFAAAFAVRHLECAGVWEAARFANCAAGLAAGRFGAQPSLPHREEVERALRDYQQTFGEA